MTTHLLANLGDADFNDADFLCELKAIEAESMGWQPLGGGAYLHQGAQPDTEADMVIQVVGIMSDASLAQANVLWLVAGG